MTPAELEPRQFEVGADGPVIRGEASGQGRGVLLLHGLSATRRYVVHGSKVLPRAGYELSVYDARGHGESDPAGSYGYADLTADLERVVESRMDEDRVILGGHSMGCHTAVTYALKHPDRVAALILIGPVFTGEEDDLGLDRWDERADALENGGPDAFADVIGRDFAEGEIKDTVTRLARDRAALHRHPAAVAEALRQVPRSRPFTAISELGAIEAPTLVVASHDEADPGHPYAVAARYAEEIPAAELTSEEKGQSPLHWQGGRLSREIAAFLERHGPA